jgi:hypothetical protein
MNKPGNRKCPGFKGDRTCAINRQIRRFVKIGTPYDLCPLAKDMLDMCREMHMSLPAWKYFIYSKN